MGVFAIQAIPAEKSPVGWDKALLCAAQHTQCALVLILQRVFSSHFEVIFI
jgi:hypothetical protein